MYAITGDDSAPSYFSIDGTTGEIMLTQSLVQDTITTYQLRISATDGGTPARTEITTLVVNVQRNLNAPVFSDSDYRVDNIIEIQPLGEVLLTVRANDLDTKVLENLQMNIVIYIYIYIYYSLLPIYALFQRPYNDVRYSLIGASNNLQYFMLDSRTGAIALKKSLTDDPDKRESYSVSVNSRIHFYIMEE